MLWTVLNFKIVKGRRKKSKFFNGSHDNLKHFIKKSKRLPIEYKTKQLTRPPPFQNKAKPISSASLGVEIYLGLDPPPFMWTLNIYGTGDFWFSSLKYISKYSLLRKGYFIKYFHIHMVFLFYLWSEICEKLKWRHSLYWKSYKVLFVPNIGTEDKDEKSV